MGGFQAVAAGLGSGVEDAAQGINAGYNTALKTADIQHGWQQDLVRNKLAQQIADQNALNAQQSHDLMRQQLIQEGWRDAGVARNPAGKYVRTLINPNLPAGQNQRTFEEPGVPPDSPEAMLGNYRNLVGMQGNDGKPVFTDMQAKEIAFRSTNLYRTDPAGIVKGFRDDAADLASKGTTNVQIPGMGKYDISSAAGQAKYGQAMADLYWGHGGIFRAMNPMAYLRSSGKLADTTGFTAGEKREFDASAKPLLSQIQYLEMAMRAESANTFDPASSQAVTAKYLPQIMQLESQLEQVKTGIASRRSGGGPNATAGKSFSISAYAKVNPDPVAQAKALAAAKAAGAPVIP